MAYKNHNSKHKEKSRQFILDLIDNNGDKINVFTLPSSNFSLENRLLKKGVNITCAEHNLDIFKQQQFKLATSSTKNIKLYYGDAFDVLQYTNKVHDIIWLDLCGSLQATTINRFLSVIQTTKINNPSYIAITYACKREYYAKSIVKAYGAKDMQDFRNNLFPKLVINFANNAGRKCELINKQSYQEKGVNAMPMKMLTFKLEEI